MAATRTVSTRPFGPGNTEAWKGSREGVHRGRRTERFRSAALAEVDRPRPDLVGIGGWTCLTPESLNRRPRVAQLSVKVIDRVLELGPVSRVSSRSQSRLDAGA